jgi:hypothetical protein
MKYSKHLVKIINMAKKLYLREQENGRFDDEKRMESLRALEDAVLKFPLYYQMRASESLYIDRGFNFLNEVYIMAKLQLLKPGLLTAVGSVNLTSSMIIIAINNNLDIVAKLAKAYLSQEVPPDTSLIYLQRLFYISSILKILIGLSTRTEFREQVYEFTHAMNKISPSPDVEIVLYCIGDKARCIQILQLS